MNTSTNTALVCAVCRRPCPTTMRVYYTLRGVDGTRFTGRLLARDTPLCDGCADSFEHAVR